MTEYRKYEFLRVPFGIHVAPSYFTLMINEIVKGLDFYLAYLNDIITYSETGEQHHDCIRHVFDQLQTANIKLKLTKCDFFKSKIHYPEKHDTIKTMPQNLKKL